ncbi:phosphotransferase enzyme family protein [Erysipelothrix urinaevulpis]
MQNIMNQFKIKGEFISSERYGSGHINDTYKIITSEKWYIAQKINHTIFENVEGLMNNIEAVTQHIKEKVLDQDLDPNRYVLQVIKTLDDELYLKNDQGYWRVYLFVKDALTYDLVENSDQFYQSALAFGLFQKQLNDFDASQLVETIPDFHNTPKRYQRLMDVINQKPERLEKAQQEIEFIIEREEFTHLVIDAYENGLIKKRVTHNDTKLNNVMIDPKTNKAICVIDLDTVMPGFVSDDFGDSIRFGCNTGLEDEQDLSQVKFDIELYKIYLKGYMESLDDILTKEEIRLLPVGAKMMTLENAIRFTTDFLEGDVYFKTNYDEHNLVRARTQIKLIKEMEKVWDQLIALSEEYL